MNCSTGIFRDGQVILDQPVDWPEGAPVTVVCAGAEAGGGVEICCDGSRWDDTPEGVRQWVEWFDALTPVFVDDELARFEADLQAMREEQKALLPRWQERTSRLLR